MRTKVFLGLMAIMVILTGLFSPISLADAAAEASGGLPVIAVVPKSLDNPIFRDAMTSAQSAGEVLGAVVVWTGSNNSDSAKQIEVIEALIECRVDGLLISCNDADPLRDVIDRAVDAGIAVATFDSDSPESGRLFYIGSENYALGEEAAQQIRDLLPEGGKVAVLEGNPDAQNLKERLKGFYDGLEGSGIECYPAVTGQDDVSKSVEVVERFTAETEALDAWFFAGGWPLFADPEALPNLRAFSEAGGQVVAIDASEPMLTFIDEGIADVLLGQGYREMGERGVEVLLAAIAEGGEYAGDDILYTSVEIVTRVDADAAP